MNIQRAVHADSLHATPALQATFGRPDPGAGAPHDLICLQFDDGSSWAIYQSDTGKPAATYAHKLLADWLSAGNTIQ